MRRCLFFGAFLLLGVYSYNALTADPRSQPGDPMPKILVIDDEPSITNLVSRLSGLHDPPAQADREAVFFSQKWGRLVARQIGPLGAVEITAGLLLDDLTVVTATGLRKRFDLLAGQLERARDEVKRLSPSTPIP